MPRFNLDTHTSTICALMALLTLPAAACDGVDEDAPESDLESIVDEDEPELAVRAPGEAGPALDALQDLQTVPDDPTKVVRSMCCELEYPGNFKINVRLRNPGPTFISECSDFFAGQHQIFYKVNHIYGSPEPFVGITAPLPMGTTRAISLSHTDYLNAHSCEAFYFTEL